MTIVVLLAALLQTAPVVPAEVLQRVEAVRQAGGRVGGQLWPGWSPTATPLAVYQRGQYIAVVGRERMPAPFVAYPAAIAEPVFIAPTSAFPAVQLANTTAELGGVQVSLVSAEDLMSRGNIEEAAALGIHEMFHAYQRKIAPNKQGNILMMLWGEYPEFSARNRVLLQMEAEALRDAIGAADPAQQLRLTAEYLGTRAERRKDLSPELTRYESGEESSEGLASYIEYKLIETAFPGHNDLLVKRLEPLSHVYNLPSDRDRFYVLGMAEAILLDKVRPGWKQEYEASPLMLDGLLGKVTAATLPTRPWGALLGDQQREMAKREAAGTERIGLMLARGKKVVIEVAKAKNKIKLRGINPNMVVQLTPNHTAFTFLQLDLDDMKLDFQGVPIIYEKLQDAFWCMLPEDLVDKALKDMGDKLKIEGRGFKLEFQDVEVSQRGKELRIHPAVAYEKKAPYKPEFVKPIKPNLFQ